MKKPKKIKVVKVKFVPPPPAPPDISMTFAEMIRIENLQPQPRQEIPDAIYKIGLAAEAINRVLARSGGQGLPQFVPRQFSECATWLSLFNPKDPTNAQVLGNQNEMEAAANRLAVILSPP